MGISEHAQCGAASPVVGLAVQTEAGQAPGQSGHSGSLSPAGPPCAVPAGLDVPRGHCA